MKRVRSCITAGLALALVAFVARTASASQLNLVPVLQISGQYSDNVFFSATNKQSDTFFLVNPGVSLDYASANTAASLAYQVGLQRHNDFNDRDNTVHRLDAQVGFKLATGWNFSVNDNLYITSDPLAYDASGDRIQRDSFTYNRIVPALSYVFGSRSMRLNARYDRVDVDYDSLIDSVQNGFGGNVSGKLGARSTIGVDYFQFDRKFDRQAPEFNIVDYTGRRIALIIDRRFSPRIAGQLSGGYEERVFEIDPATRNFDSFVFDVRASGDFPEVFSWSVGYNQRLNDLAIRGAYKVKRVDIDLRKSIAERLRLEFNGYWQNSVNDQIAEEANYFGFLVESQVMVAKFLNVWLGYNFTDRESGNGSLEPYEENRVNFGLTLSYGL